MAVTRDPLQATLLVARCTQALDITRIFAEENFHQAISKELACEVGSPMGLSPPSFACNTEALLTIHHWFNEMSGREQQFAQRSGQDRTSFFLAYVRLWMAVPWPGVGVFREMHLEMLMRSERRDLYYLHVLAPTFTVSKHFFHVESEEAEVWCVR